MTENCTVVRHNVRLQKTLSNCQDWKARFKRVKLSDPGMWTNQNLSFTRAVRGMIIMAEAIIEGAVRRNESRGAHYKPEFPERDDANFLKATITTYDTANDRPQTDYGPVDTSLVTPRARTYGKKADAPATDANAKLTESAVPSTVSSGAPV
jgi:succinate dehydrogenase / fumarate reductase flavoprotein subunit